MPRLRVADPLWLTPRAKRAGPRYATVAGDLRAIGIDGAGTEDPDPMWHWNDEKGGYEPVETSDAHFERRFGYWYHPETH